VTFTGDQTGRLERRLVDAIVGEFARREELVRTAGVTSLDDYRQALKLGSDIEQLPDTFVILDDITWLRPGFDAALRSLVARGHRLGMRARRRYPLPAVADVEPKRR